MVARSAVFIVSAPCRTATVTSGPRAQNDSQSSDRRPPPPRDSLRGCRLRRPHAAGLAAPACARPAWRQPWWRLGLVRGLDRRLDRATAAAAGAAYGTPSSAEHRDDLHQLLRLVAQALGRGGAFFHQRGVLLRGLVHLRDRLADLADAVLCSLLAALISPMMSVTRAIEATISVIVDAGAVDQHRAVLDACRRWPRSAT